MDLAFDEAELDHGERDHHDHQNHRLRGRAAEVQRLHAVLVDLEHEDLGHRLMIYCEDRGDLYEKITRDFCREGCLMRMATLEDVFLKLTGRELRE